MVIFEHHTVRQIISVIVTAAGSYGIFFKYAHVRDRLSRIEKLYPRIFQHTCHFVCISGYPAHSLKKIERCAFTGQYRACTAFDSSDMLSCSDRIAVGNECINNSAVVKHTEDSAEYIETCDYAVSLAEKLRGSTAAAFHY